jgi:hypothetical protein
MVMQLDLPLREGDELKTFYNSVLRRIFGTKREEVKCGWRKLQNFKYSSANIRTIKSRRLRPAGNLARMGEKRIL